MTVDRSGSNEGAADLYDPEYFAGLPIDSDRIWQILSHLHFNPADQVCEFGSGLGHILFAIQNKVAFGLGVDFAEYAIEESRRTASAAGIRNLEFECVDVTELPERAGNCARFDKVLMMDVTEHIDDNLMRDFLGAARSILKSGGELIIHTPNAGYLIERLKDQGVVLKQLPGHVAVRDEQQYEDLLKDAGFGESRAVYLPHYRSPLRQVDQILMHVPLLGRLFRSRLLITAVKP